MPFTVAVTPKSKLRVYSQIYSETKHALPFSFCCVGRVEECPSSWLTSSHAGTTMHPQLLSSLHIPTVTTRCILISKWRQYDISTNPWKLFNFIYVQILYYGNIQWFSFGTWLLPHTYTGVIAIISGCYFSFFASTYTVIIFILCCWYTYLSYLRFHAVMKNVAIYRMVLVFWQIHININISVGRNETYQDLLQMIHEVVIKLTYMNNHIYI